nr:MAG TPA: hypothetical protein [Caudoviricetes sp.]
MSKMCKIILIFHLKSSLFLDDYATKYFFTL